MRKKVEITTCDICEHHGGIEIARNKCEVCGVDCCDRCFRVCDGSYKYIGMCSWCRSDAIMCGNELKNAIIKTIKEYRSKKNA